MTEARDGNGKLYFEFYRLKNAVVIEILRNKILATFIIYDNGKLKVKTARATR